MKSKAIIVVILFLVQATSLHAQEMVGSFVDFSGGLSSQSVQLFILITALSLLPMLIIMLTCFPFMVTVLSVMRQGLGLQQSPPNIFLVGLAVFLTYFVMEPVFLASWQYGVKPMVYEGAPIEPSVRLAISPFRDFMSLRIDPDTYSALSNLRFGSTGNVDLDEAPLSVVFPSFMLSEMARAFQVGFLIFLPFLIIDLVVAAILMSMGMMMVPPAVVSLPLKLAFFVVANGWSLITSALVSGYH